MPTSLELDPLITEQKNELLIPEASPYMGSLMSLPPKDFDFSGVPRIKLPLLVTMSGRNTALGENLVFPADCDFVLGLGDGDTVIIEAVRVFGDNRVTPSTTQELLFGDSYIYRNLARIAKPEDDKPRQSKSFEPYIFQHVIPEPPVSFDDKSLLAVVLGTNGINVYDPKLGLYYSNPRDDFGINLNSRLEMRVVGSLPSGHISYAYEFDIGNKGIVVLHRRDGVTFVLSGFNKEIIEFLTNLPQINNIDAAEIGTSFTSRSSEFLSRLNTILHDKEICVRHIDEGLSPDSNLSYVVIPSIGGLGSKTLYSHSLP